MVRKEMLMVSLMAGGYPIDGKPKEHHNLPSGKQIVGFVVALIIVAAIAIFAGQTPVKTTDPLEVKIGGMMGDGKVQTNTVVDAATGAVIIPADALVMIAGSGDISPKYSLNGYPKNIYLKNSGILYKDIKITSVAITGTAVDIKTGEIRQGMTDFAVGFQKNGVTVASVSVVTNPNPFKADRKPESLGADTIYFYFG